MSERENAAIAIIVILVIIFLIPFGIIALTVHPETYHAVTGEPVRDAANTAGVKVANSTNTSWNYPGALGGNSYTLQNEAGHRVTIHTQKFESPESRDAAIATFYTFTVGKAKSPWTLEIVGNHVILIGPDPGGIMKDIYNELRKQQIRR